MSTVRICRLTPISRRSPYVADLRRLRLSAASLHHACDIARASRRSNPYSRASSAERCQGQETRVAGHSAGWWRARALTCPDGYKDEAPVPQLRDLSPRSSLAISKTIVAGMRPLLAASIPEDSQPSSRPIYLDGESHRHPHESEPRTEKTQRPPKGALIAADYTRSSLAKLE